MMVTVSTIAPPQFNYQSGDMIQLRYNQLFTKKTINSFRAKYQVMYLHTNKKDTSLIYVLKIPNNGEARFFYTVFRGNYQPSPDKKLILNY